MRKVETISYQESNNKNGHFYTFMFYLNCTEFLVDDLNHSLNLLGGDGSKMEERDN